MTRVVVVAVILCCGALAWAGARPKEELKPIAAAEAEGRANDTRDAVIDLLANGIDAHWHVGEWDACIRLLRQSIELDPHFVDAYTDLAWTLSNLNRDAEAVAAYREGIEKNPEAADIHQQFGLFYHRRHKYDEAVQQFRKAIQKGAPRAWQHMLPSTLELAGRKQEALAEWQALLKRFPEDEVAKRRIARLEEELKPEVHYD